MDREELIEKLEIIKKGLDEAGKIECDWNAIFEADLVLMNLINNA